MDLSLILYLHTLKLNLSTIGVLRYYEKEMEYFLPAKHRLKLDLEKYGYVHNNSITEKGRQLLEEIDNWSETYTPQGKVKKKEIIYSPEFLSFWGTFPKTDDYQGNIGTRDFRKNKEESFVQWEEIMLEHTPEEIMKALELQVKTLINKSIKEGKNHLQYLPNTYNYLKGRKFKMYLGKEIPTEKKQELINTKDLF